MFRMLVLMLLLMNDGARNARLNETRIEWSSTSLNTAASRGETSAVSRPTTTSGFEAIFAPVGLRKCGDG